MWPCFVLALCGLCTPSWAQSASPEPSANGWDEAPLAEQKANAEKLFDRGLQDMLQSRYEQGCPVLKESYRLDPLPGALFTLAECEAGWGRTTSALVHYRRYLSQYQRMSRTLQLRQFERAEVARDKITILSGAVPRLTLVAPKDLPPDAVVERDSVVVPRSLFGVPVALDPGDHHVSAHAAGYAPAHWTITLTEAEQRTVSIRLERPPPKPAPDAAMRTSGYVAASIGGVGLLVGIIAGAVTLGHRGTIHDECVDVFCSPAGLDAAAAASTSGTVADVGFGVGVVGLGAAAVLLLVASDDAAAAAHNDTAKAAGAWLQPTVDVALAGGPGEAPGSKLVLGLRGRW